MPLVFIARGSFFVLGLTFKPYCLVFWVMKKILSVLVVFALGAGAWWVLSPMLQAPDQESTVEVGSSEDITRPVSNAYNDWSLLSEAERKFAESILKIKIGDVPANRRAQATDDILAAFATQEDVMVDNKLPPKAYIPPLIKTGDLMMQDGQSVGKVLMYQDDQNYTIMRIEDLDLPQTPDLWMYLTMSPDTIDPDTDMQFGKLKGNIGSQNATIKPELGDTMGYTHMVVVSRALGRVVAASELKAFE